MRGRLFGQAALAAVAAVVLYLVRPGAVTDDTFAFLDWGRDLRHGHLLLEHRTFHPLPILTGALVSFFGSAAPTVTVLLSLATLVLLATASWRIVVLLGFGQPAPALAALFGLASPLLAGLALTAYINLPFAALVLWALVFELEGRRRGAWALLMIAALVRPEGWAFLFAYGVLSWWRAEHRWAPRRWVPIAALCLIPIALWLGLEWSFLGHPLYSFNSTTGPNVVHTGNDTAGGFWNSLRFGLPVGLLAAAGVGALAVAWLAPRRLAATVFGVTVVALISLVTLALTGFNVPSRHFSVLVPLVGTFAAAGTVAPSRLLTPSRPARRRIAAAATAVAGGALVVGLATTPAIRALRHDFKDVSAQHDAGHSLARAVDRARPYVDVRGARRHSVAAVGAVVNSELAWDLRVPFDAVSDRLGPATRIMVEPSWALWSRLDQLRLTDRTPFHPPPGWRPLLLGAWKIYFRGKRIPIRLRDRHPPHTAG